MGGIPPVTAGGAGPIKTSLKGKVYTSIKEATLAGFTFENIDPLGLPLGTVFIGGKEVATYKGTHILDPSKTLLYISIEDGVIYNKNGEKLHKLSSEQFNALKELNNLVAKEMKDKPLNPLPGHKTNGSESQPAVAFENPNPAKKDEGTNALTRFEPNVGKANRARERARDGIF